MEDVTSKSCRKCAERKPLSMFAKQHTQPDGLRSDCKACRAIADRAYLLKKRFGISVQEYERLLDEQGGMCALCETTDPAGRWGTFHVDHDHDNGRVRGLLCHWCNTALGRFGDSPAALLRVYEYTLGRPLVEDLRAGRLVA